MGSQPTQVSLATIRRTIATALAAAFGFIIALMWRDVVEAALKIAGVNLQPGGGVADLGIFIGTAIGVTILMVVLIVIVSRWSGSE